MPRKETKLKKLRPSYSRSESKWNDVTEGKSSVGYSVASQWCSDVKRSYEANEEHTWRDKITITSKPVQRKLDKRLKDMRKKHLRLLVFLQFFLPSLEKLILWHAFPWNRKQTHTTYSYLYLQVQKTEEKISGRPVFLLRYTGSAARPLTEGSNALNLPKG